MFTSDASMITSSFYIVFFFHFLRARIADFILLGPNAIVTLMFDRRTCASARAYTHRHTRDSKLSKSMVVDTFLRDTYYRIIKNIYVIDYCVDERNEKIRNKVYEYIIIIYESLAADERNQRIAIYKYTQNLQRQSLGKPRRNRRIYSLSDISTERSHHERKLIINRHDYYYHHRYCRHYDNVMN